MSLQYSIQDLERISGIKAHTIRIWEKRYSLLNPTRTQTNIRTYSDEDMRKILNVKTLIGNGWKISDVSELDAGELDNYVWDSMKATREPEHVYDLYMQTLISATLTFNTVAFNKAFDLAEERFGLSQTMRHIVSPFLYKIGLMWSVLRMHPGQEHFASNLLRRKLFAAIDGQDRTLHKGKFLLALPPWEEHEIGLLFAHYLLSDGEYEVTYLGQKVPIDALVNTAEVIHPTHVLTFLVKREDNTMVEQYLKDMSKAFGKNIQVFVATNPDYLEDVIVPKNLRMLYSPQDLIDII